MATGLLPRALSILAVGLGSLCLCACQPSVGLTDSGLSNWNAGILTFYGGAPDGMSPDNPSYGTKEGSCGYGVIQKNLYPYFAAAALSPQNPFYKAGPLNGCGQCFQIQCTDPRPGVCVKDSSGQPASIVAMISDSCPECEAEHLDIQAKSFEKIAIAGFGRIQMHYRRVACTPPADMKVAVDNFGGAGAWIRLSIDDTGGRGAVRQVSVKSSTSGSWQPMTNRWGATWELNNAPQPPLDFQIVCDDGEAVAASNVVKQNGGISGNVLKFATGVQFTINDPSGKVQAFDGPQDNGGEQGTSSSAPAIAGTVPGGETAQNCVDIPSPGAFSCQQQQSWGKCSDPATTKGGYCAKTCGRCTTAGATAVVEASPSPAPAGAQAQAQAQPTGCSDIPPPGGFDCKQQQEWGKCTADFIIQGNYCAQTCGRCQASTIPSSQQPNGSPPAPPSSPVPTTAQPLPTSVPMEGNLDPAGSCTDIPPDASATCAQRKDWGQCNDSITTSRNFCAATCGRCTPASTGGRKMLRL